MRAFTRYTEAIGQAIAEKIAKGLTDREAALVLGLKPKTVNHWMVRRPDFQQAVEAAKAKRIELRINCVEKHDDGWQSAAWLLERLNPDRFARPETQAQMNIIMNQLGEGGSVHFNVAVLSEAQKQLNLIQAVAGKPGELNPQLPPLPAHARE